MLARRSRGFIPAVRADTGLHRQRLSGRRKRTLSGLRLNPAPFVPASGKPAGLRPPAGRPRAGPEWAERHENAPGNAASGRGARVRGPSRCQPPDSGGSRALPRRRRGPASALSSLPGPPPPPAGKRPASRRHAPAAGRAALGAEAGRGRGQRARGGARRGGSRAQEALGGPSRPRVPRAAWTRAAAAIPLARGRERPARCRSGQCGPVREGAGGRVSETQSAAATAKRTCWSLVPPPPPFPYPPNGTERGPATLRLCRPPRRLGRSLFLPGLWLLRSSPPPRRSGPAGSPAPLRRGARSM